MPDYKIVSMPANELAALIRMVDERWRPNMSLVEERALERLKLAAEGKDRRAHNTHNTWPRLPRGLDPR